jgi:uncharacterized membrane protein
MKKVTNTISILQLFCGIGCLTYGILYIAGTLEASPVTAGIYAIACGLFGIMDSFRNK